MITEADIPKPTSSAEKSPQQQNLYGAELDTLREEGAHLNHGQLARSINENLFAQLAQDAAMGRLTTQRRGEDGSLETRSLTVEDIFVSQLGAFLRKHDANRADPSSFSHISRSGGLRDTVRAIMDTPQLEEPFKVAILYRQAQMQRDAEAAARASTRNLQEQGVEAPKHPESFYESAMEELGGEAVERVVQQPAPEVSAAQRIVGAEASALAETEDEMYARFERETQKDLSELYRQHRLLDPQSAEAAALENQIKYAKEDLGGYGAKRRKLRGM